MFSRWIKEAQSAGWRLDGVAGASARLVCACEGCAGVLSVSIDNPGPAPERCSRPHAQGYAADTFARYEDLVTEFRRRRVQIGLDQITLGEAMGSPDGYISKLESFSKIASPVTLLLWAATLGVRITIAPAELPTATARAIERRASSPYAINQARFKHDR